MIIKIKNNTSNKKTKQKTMCGMALPHKFSCENYYGFQKDFQINNWNNKNINETFIWDKNENRWLLLFHT